MQKLWKNGRVQFQSGNKETVLTSTSNHVEETQPRSSVRATSVVTDHRNNKPNGFVSSTVHSSSLNGRKRPAAESSAEEPSTKKIETNNNVANKSNILPKIEVQLLTGDVSQTLRLNKEYPNTGAFHEVYGIVYKIQSKDRQTVLLLRNDMNRGPVLKGVYNEVDLKMVEVKPGILQKINFSYERFYQPVLKIAEVVSDLSTRNVLKLEAKCDRVRCVGKMVNNSWLLLFKITLQREYCHLLIQRLFSLSAFAAKQATRKSTNQ